MESTEDSGRSLSFGRALCAAGRARWRREPLHQPLTPRARAMPVVATILLPALCAALIATMAQAEDPASPGPDTPSRERPVKVLPGSPDNATDATSVSAADLASINLSMKTDNSAGLTLDIIPGGEVIAGSKIGFRFTTKKPGYL